MPHLVVFLPFLQQDMSYHLRLNILSALYPPPNTPTGMPLHSHLHHGLPGSRRIAAIVLLMKLPKIALLHALSVL